MPAKRKSTGPRSTSASQQSTLSFHGKPNQITKPSVQLDAKATKKDPSVAEEVAPIDLTNTSQSEVDETTVEEVSPKQQPEPEVDPLEANGTAVTTEDVLGGRAEQSDMGAIGGKTSGWVDDEEKRARKMTETQIKKYWRQKEAERLAPRVHQGDLTIDEKILREWDMSGQYGPCIGIARLKRWKRANLLGLNPPIEVLAVLLREIDSGESEANVAHVDKLMGSRVVEV